MSSATQMAEREQEPEPLKSLAGVNDNDDLMAEYKSVAKESADLRGVSYEDVWAELKPWPVNKYRQESKALIFMPRGAEDHGPYSYVPDAIMYLRAEIERL